jgi:hypothetical protein
MTLLFRCRAASGHFRCLQLLHHAGRVLSVHDASGATPLHSGKTPNL